MTIAIRPYRGTDEAALLALWNATLTHDPITASLFHTQVLLDANFDPDRLLVAELEGELVGFVLALVRQVPYYDAGLEPERAWITAFGVHPAYRRQGIGRALFQAVQARLVGRHIMIAPYVPHYFTPGVDGAAYPAALPFLQALGFEGQAEALSMQADLNDFTLLPAVIALEQRCAADGLVVRPLMAADLPALKAFLVGEFGWDWFRFAAEYLQVLLGPGSDELGAWVAVQGAQVVGYCQHRRERFGPFGVAAALRGRGLGRVLLYHALAQMRAQGFHVAWFLWTDERAARLYRGAGFQIVRRFTILQAKP